MDGLLGRLLAQVNFGHAALRVQEDTECAIKMKLLDAAPRLGEFGERCALSLVGTVMITYRNVRYNLPVEILVLPGYPSTPPRAFVRPTSDMMIRDRHQSVDAHGVVYLPYLSEWNDQHTLADLVRTISSAFSADPPLFARLSRNTTLRIREDARAAPEMRFIQRRLKERLHVMSEDMHAELQGQRRLRRAAVDVSDAACYTCTAKDALQAKVQSIDAAGNALKAWIRARVDADCDLPWLECVDVNSLTVLSALSHSNAIEDALYELDRGLSDRTVNLDDILREIRRLTSRQFLNKAHVTKMYAHRQGICDAHSEAPTPLPC